jgi:hypothetical protein
MQADIRNDKKKGVQKVLNTFFVSLLSLTKLF